MNTQTNDQWREEFYRSQIKQRDDEAQRRHDVKESIRDRYLDELKSIETTIKLAENRKYEILQLIERDINHAMVQIQ
jgi:hypothetical protein